MQRTDTELFLPDEESQLSKTTSECQEEDLAWHPYTPPDLQSRTNANESSVGDVVQSTSTDVLGWNATLSNVFCTWPHATIPFEEFERNLKQQYPTTEWCIVCHEKHEDGEPHMHAVIHFSKKTYLTHKKLDLVVGKHGDYKSVRNLTKSIEYVKKDKDFFCIGAVPEGKVSLMKEISQKIRDGKRARELDMEYPGVYLLHKRKIDEYITWIEIEQKKSTLKPWEECPLREISDVISLPDSSILEWLLKNIKKPREFKQHQLYIWGPPGCGKTHLINVLSLHLSVYVIPTDEEFYDEWEDGLYDLAIIDEFKAQKTIQWMNQFLQGSSMTMRQKGKQSLKKQNIPTIILSNYGLHECYHKAYASGILDTLYARLLCVNVSERINIFKTYTMRLLGCQPGGRRAR